LSTKGSHTLKRVDQGPVDVPNVKDENHINIVKFGNLFPIGLIGNDDGDHVFFVVDNEALGLYISFKAHYFRELEISLITIDVVVVC
jgi:hypothetical protein